MDGLEFERQIRTDTVQRVVRVIRDNLVLNATSGLNWMLLDDTTMREVRALRERLHPGKEPRASQAQASQEHPSGVPDVQAAQAPAQARRPRTAAHPRPAKTRKRVKAA